MMNAALDNLFNTAAQADRDNDLETLQLMVTMLEAASNEGVFYAEKLLMRIETGEYNI